MKNLLVLFSVFMLSLVAFPQSSVNLTVKLNPIQSITVNNQQSDVILDLRILFRLYQHTNRDEEDSSKEILYWIYKSDNFISLNRLC